MFLMLNLSEKLCIFISSYVLFFFFWYEKQITEDCSTFFFSVSQYKFTFHLKTGLTTQEWWIWFSRAEEREPERDIFSCSKLFTRTLSPMRITFLSFTYTFGVFDRHRLASSHKQTALSAGSFLYCYYYPLCFNFCTQFFLQNLSAHFP